MSEDDGLKKTAILMLALGHDEAAEVFKYLGPKDVQKLGTAMTSVGKVSRDQIEAVLAADRAFENRILNVTSNEPVTVGHCAREILAALDWPARIVQPENSFQGAGYKSLDSSRFLAATGWKPRFTIDAGVRAASEEIHRA